MDEESSDSLALRFSVKNLTSGTELRLGAPIRLCEWLEKGMILEFPGRSCGSGHNLTITIQPERGKEEHPAFVANCKVEAIEHNEDATDQVTLVLVQYNQSAWQDLLALFEQRQEDILKFLAAARGHD